MCRPDNDGGHGARKVTQARFAAPKKFGAAAQRRRQRSPEKRGRPAPRPVYSPALQLAAVIRKQRNKIALLHADSSQNTGRTRSRNQKAAVEPGQADVQLGSFAQPQRLAAPAALAAVIIAWQSPHPRLPRRRRRHRPPLRRKVAAPGTERGARRGGLRPAPPRGGRPSRLHPRVSARARGGGEPGPPGGESPGVGSPRFRPALRGLIGSGLQGRGGRFPSQKGPLPAAGACLVAGQNGAGAAFESPGQLLVCGVHTDRARAHGVTRTERAVPPLARRRGRGGVGRRGRGGPNGARVEGAPPPVTARVSTAFPARRR